MRSARVSAGRGQRFRSMRVAVGVLACALAAGGWAVPSVSGADGVGGRPLAAVNATASPQPDNTSGQSSTSDVVGVPAVRMVPTLAELGQPASGVPTVTAQGVSAALLPLLAGPSLPPPLGVVVTEPATGDVLVDLQGETPLTPASTVKLLTAAAALNTFGTEHRLTTTVVAPAPDSVVLVGAGDPLLTKDPQPRSGGASLTQLAAVTAGQLRADGVEAVSLAVDDSVFSGPKQGEGWEAEDVELCLVTPISALAVHRTTPAEVCVPDYDPAISAGRIFAELLNGFGIQVLGEVGRAATPVGESEVLASVESAPMSAMVEQMVTDSDNVSAEMLAHLVGGEVVGEASFQGGVRATLAALADLGVSSQGVTLLDGSGLSLLDLLPPRTASELLNVALNGANDQLWPMLTGLPVAGSTGTLMERFATPPTEPGRGDVRGKTGTLTGVSALSGQVVTESGQLLSYVMISNGAEDILASREALDQAATLLAECGCGADPA